MTGDHLNVAKRAHVEHPYAVMRRVFHFTRTYVTTIRRVGAGRPSKLSLRDRLLMPFVHYRV